MDNDAVGHIAYKLEWRYTAGGKSLVGLENELNAMVQLGWQVFQIIPMPDGWLLIVYSGFVNNDEPMQS